MTRWWTSAADSQVTDRSRLGTARQFNDENFMKAGPYWAAGLSSAPLKLIIQKVLSTINIQDDKNRPFKIIEVDYLPNGKNLGFPHLCQFTLGIPSNIWTCRDYHHPWAPNRETLRFFLNMATVDLPFKIISWLIFHSYININKYINVSLRVNMSCHLVLFCLTSTWLWKSQCLVVSILSDPYFLFVDPQCCLLKSCWTV